MTSARCQRTAFTIVELLIVLIILGILAAMVVPRFTEATQDARLSALVTNIQTVRAQIELYKTEHGGKFPALARIEEQLTQASRPDGETAPVGTADHELGPYLQAIPNNPYTGNNSVADSPVGTSSWYYNENTGEFRANDRDEHRRL